MKFRLTCLLAAVALCACACATTPATPPISSLVPSDARIIGGGYRIFYTAPADGTFYVVDRKTGRLLTSWNRKKGDLFEVTASTMAEIAQALNVPLGELEPVAYFAPGPVVR
jgi:hypothetical protein